MSDALPETLPEEDFYYDGPFVVFTAAYLRKRGTCCGNGCRHCPYDAAGNIIPAQGSDSYQV